MSDLPRVEQPAPEADQPAWGKVGIIAFLSFAVGVAWPRLAGVSLGPNPPADAPRAAPASSVAAAARTSLAATAPLVVPTGSGVVAPTPGGETNEQGVTVSAGELQKCRDPKGKATETCDKIALDPIVTPRLKELSKCPSALGLTGKVSFGLDLDFKSKTLKVQRAKAASKLPRTTLDGLTRCIERSLSGVSLDDLAHENSRYSLVYDVAFQPPGQVGDPAAGDAGKTTTLDGRTAKVVWGSCQVRETPKNGTVVAKIPRKAEVKLLEKKDDWYRVEYGTDKKQGWVFGGALDQQP